MDNAVWASRLVSGRPRRDSGTKHLIFRWRLADGNVKCISEGMDAWVVKVKVWFLGDDIR